MPQPVSPTPITPVAHTPLTCRCPASCCLHPLPQAKEATSTLTPAAAHDPPAAASAAPPLSHPEAAHLSPLTPLRGRVHIMKSDLPYFDLYGPDPTVARPSVLHVSGFTPTTRAGFVAARFEAAGFSGAQVGKSAGGALADHDALMRKCIDALANLEACVEAGGAWGPAVDGAVAG
jgi:hypothetical protein